MCTAGQSPAEAQALTGASRRVGQHVPLQRRGRQTGALHGGRVYGHGGPGELRAQIQGENEQHVTEESFTAQTYATAVICCMLLFLAGSADGYQRDVHHI